MPRSWLAFFLGLLPFFALVLLGDAVGPLVTNLTLAVFYFTCQLLLSDGSSNAYRTDWPVMLALNATDLAVVVVVAIAQNPRVIFTSGIEILLAAWGGTYAGAVVASLHALRQRGPR